MNNTVAVTFLSAHFAQNIESMELGKWENPSKLFLWKTNELAQILPLIDIHHPSKIKSSIWHLT